MEETLRPGQKKDFLSRQEMEKLVLEEGKRGMVLKEDRLAWQKWIEERCLYTAALERGKGMGETPLTGGNREGVR